MRRRPPRLAARPGPPRQPHPALPRHGAPSRAAAPRRPSRAAPRTSGSRRRHRPPPPRGPSRPLRCRCPGGDRLAAAGAEASASRPPLSDRYGRCGGWRRAGSGWRRGRARGGKRRGGARGAERAGAAARAPHSRPRRGGETHGTGGGRGAAPSPRPLARSPAEAAASPPRSAPLRSTPPRPSPAASCPRRAGRAPAPFTWLGCSACSEEAIFPGPANPSPPKRWNALTAVPPAPRQAERVERRGIDAPGGGTIPATSLRLPVGTGASGWTGSGQGRGEQATDRETVWVAASCLAWPGRAGIRTSPRPAGRAAAMAAPLKRCLLLQRDGWEQHGVAASCLRELRDKGEGRPPGERGVPAGPCPVPGGCRAPPDGGLGRGVCEVAALGPIRAVERTGGERVCGGSEGRWE